MEKNKQERNEVDKQTLQITVIKKKHTMAQKSRIHKQTNYTVVTLLQKMTASRLTDITL